MNDDINLYNQKRFLFLVGKIPKWELYLTDKQLECANTYICTFSCQKVDEKLNLQQGTCSNRLFGSSKNVGAIYKLEEVYKKLNDTGYFKKIENVSNKSNISNDTLNKVKELFKIVTELENYSEYLTDSQNERLYQFLKLRSFKECAKYFNITEDLLRQSILGKDNNDCVLTTLKKVYDENHISDWNDI